MFELKIRNME